VLHLIGEPGLGKSKLLREWLAAAESRGDLAGWTRMQAHGVPYGGYPYRVWSLLLASLNLPEVPNATGIPMALPEAEEVLFYLRRRERPALMIVDDLHWVDAPSRHALGRVIAGLEGSRALVILSYRPSFTTAAPSGAPRIHRQLRLRGLGRDEMRRLIQILSAARGFELPAARLDEIAEKAAGNPLYADEAVAYLAGTDGKSGGRPAPLPSSLPDLLIQRIQATLATALPQIERQSHAAGFAFTLDRESALRKLESLEERLAAWLDRFDVIEEEAPPVVRRFLRGLETIDGRLALLSLFLGRQRPHRHRLAQALARLGGGKGGSRFSGKTQHGPQA
jgi:hypothetical protein